MALNEALCDYLAPSHQRGFLFAALASVGAHLRLLQTPLAMKHRRKTSDKRKEHLPWQAGPFQYPGMRTWDAAHLVNVRLKIAFRYSPRQRGAISGE